MLHTPQVGFMQTIILVNQLLGLLGELGVDLEVAALPVNVVDSDSLLGCWSVEKGGNGAEVIAQRWYCAGNADVCNVKMYTESPKKKPKRTLHWGF